MQDLNVMVQGMVQRKYTYLGGTRVIETSVVKKIGKKLKDKKFIILNMHYIFKGILESPG